MVKKPVRLIWKSFVKLLVPNVYVINAFDTKKLEKTIKEAVALDEIAVIIAQAPCVLLKKSPITNRYFIDQAKCKKCGLCMKPGCPAITKKENGDIVINETICNGCGLCVDLCKFDAIKKTE